MPQATLQMVVMIFPLGTPPFIFHLGTTLLQPCPEEAVEQGQPFLCHTGDWEMDFPPWIAAPPASHFKQNAWCPTAVPHHLTTVFVKSSSRMEGKGKKKKIFFLHCFCPTPETRPHKSSSSVLRRVAQSPSKRHSATFPSQQPGTGQAACHASPGKENQGLPAGEIIILITNLPLLSLPSLPVLIIIRQLHIKNAICD